jgi:hypothetical protein
MLWAPLIVVVCTIGCDVASLYLSEHLLFSSPLRQVQMWRDIPLQNKIYAIAMEGIAVIFACLIVQLTRHALRYENGTRDVLEEFRGKLVAAGVIEGSEAED